MKLLALLAALAVTPLAGSWRPLPAAPVTVDASKIVSVWTGKQLVVFGRNRAVGNVAASYDPAAREWTRLEPPAGRSGGYPLGAVWTGRQMLVFGPGSDVAFEPRTNRWTQLRRSLPGGIVVWTGREAIGWGGGCCGDARSDGAAYDPASGRFRTLARSPLAASQGPIGAWDGRELLLFVSGDDVDGKPLPDRFARAAAYNPRTNRWRRIAAMPGWGGKAVWSGRELLVAGDGTRVVAYSPARNRWRRLVRLPAARHGAAVLWTGTRLVVWGGSATRGGRWTRDGFAYDPRTSRWSSIPAAPFPRRESPTVAWAGRSLIVWGGVIGTPLGSTKEPDYRSDGATFDAVTNPRSRTGTPRDSPRARAG